MNYRQGAILVRVDADLGGRLERLTFALIPSRIRSWSIAYRSR
ncbi:hypothetical protein [Nocardia sp. R6R-6]